MRRCCGLCCSMCDGQVGKGLVQDDEWGGGIQTRESNEQWSVCMIGWLQGSV